MKVKSVKKLNEKYLCYDIGIEDNNNFYANGILVHNCQNLIGHFNNKMNSNYNIYRDKKFIVREKLDGTSATFTLRRIGKDKYDYIICSRNLVVGGNFFNKKANLYFDENVYIEMSKKYDIENILKKLIVNQEWVILQGEIIGESIQKNKYGIQGRDLYLFNYLDSELGSDKKQSCIPMEEYFKSFGLKWCPLLEKDYELPQDEFGNIDLNGLLCEADGMSVLKHDIPREGLVIRNYDHNISFKVISNEFLLKYDSK